LICAQKQIATLTEAYPAPVLPIDIPIVRTCCPTSRAASYMVSALASPSRDPIPCRAPKSPMRERIILIGQRYKNPLPRLGKTEHSSCHTSPDPHPAFVRESEAITRPWRVTTLNNMSFAGPLKKTPIHHCVAAAVADDTPIFLSLCCCCCFTSAAALSRHNRERWHTSAPPASPAARGNPSARAGRSSDNTFIVHALLDGPLKQALVRRHIAIIRPTVLSQNAH